MAKKPEKTTTTTTCAIHLTCRSHYCLPTFRFISFFIFDIFFKPFMTWLFKFSWGTLICFHRKQLWINITVSVHLSLSHSFSFSPFICPSHGYQGVTFAWLVWEHLCGRCCEAWELIGWHVGGVCVIGARRSVKATCTSICLTSLLQVWRMVTHELHLQPVFHETIIIAI